MDVRLHQVPECLVNRPVPVQGIHAVESISHDEYPEMPAPVLCAFVTNVHVALVLYHQFFRGDGRFDPFPNHGYSLCRIHHGNTGTNGDTSTDSYAPECM